MALTAQYIEAVITDIDQNGFPNKRRSTGYCLAHEGTHYPPKYVVGRAHAQERNGHSGEQTNITEASQPIVFSGNVASMSSNVLVGIVLKA
jgi:hypothetical protein